MKQSYARAQQTRLADYYHQTKLPDNEVCVDGETYLVGLDAREQETPYGRFIWFAVNNPLNGGTLLRGQTLTDYRVKDIATIRNKAIKVTVSRTGLKESEAAKLVDELLSMPNAELYDPALVYKTPEDFV
jgi:hypothetical protein